MPPDLDIHLAFALTAGCEGRPPADIVDAEIPEPGDPVVYAPDGWPLEIGEMISDGRRFELESKFPSLGGMEAEKVPQAFRNDEHQLPEHLHGHIEYEEIRVLWVEPSSKGEDGHIQHKKR